MRDFGSASAAYLAARGGVMSRTLVWITAKNRTTGAAESLGLWTGDDHQDFSIGGVTRTYYGAGAMLSVDPITMQAGLVVRMQRMVLSALSPEVTQIFRGYDPRLAPVEIHRALFDLETHALIEEPHRVFLGWIEEAPIATPEIGGQATIEVTMASSARSMTRALAIKKSDSTQRMRGGDRFRRYIDVSGSVGVWWGEKRT